MKRFALLLAFCLLSAAPAFAQYTDIPGVPHTTVVDQVDGQSYQIYVGALNAGGTPSLGVFEFVPSTGLWKGDWNSSLSIDWPPPPVTPAQANAFIVSLLPQINGAIANRFSLTVSAPAACGNPSCDAVNLALFTSWSFTKASDGSTVLTQH